MFVWSRWLWPILAFILGLGLVVFVHELGHFLVAKWVGIKVEKFALGFGRRVLGIKWGETDYCLNAIPLGGYVKMLGQEDFKPLTENEKPDPRSYEAKSVGARFAVISAGVIMNVILAAILFIIIGMVGMKTPAPVVGDVEPTFPAAMATIQWQGPAMLVAGAPQATPATMPATAPSMIAATAPAEDKSPWAAHLRKGDRITRIDGDSLALSLNNNRITRFQDIAMTAVLADPKESYTFTIERTVDGFHRTGLARMGVKDADGALMFGISPALDDIVKIAEDTDGRPEQENIAPFQAEDRIVSLNGKTVNNSWELAAAQDAFDGSPVTVQVLRNGQVADLGACKPTIVPASGVIHLNDGTRILGLPVRGEDKTVTIALKDGGTRTINLDDVSRESLSILGMTPRLRVQGVILDSAAARAGLQSGDIIVSYGDKVNPTHKELMAINEQRAAMGTNIEVLRDGKLLPPMSVTPKKKGKDYIIGMQVTGDHWHAVVAGVGANSPAAKAGIESGATLRAINGTPVQSWADVYQALKANVDKPVTITYQVRSTEKTAHIDKLTPAMFDPQDYRFTVTSLLTFAPLMEEIKKDNPIAAVTWGGQETVRMVISSYASIKSLIRGWASPKQMSGPLGLGDIAVSAARKGFIEFVYLIAFINAAIAVFNFLPIPVVDGGHAVFLLIEKIRGKPLPVKVMNITQTVGLILLLCVFLAVTFNDIRRIVDRW